MIQEPEGFELRDRRSDKSRSAADWTPADGIFHLVFTGRRGQLPAVSAFIDFVAEEAAHASLGIYKLEGDRLTIALAYVRPTQFVVKPGHADLLYVLKRVEAAKVAPELKQPQPPAASQKRPGRPLLPARRSPPPSVASP